MTRLTETPEDAFLLQIGEALYYEAGGGDEHGELYVFTVRKHANEYLQMVEPFSSTLEVRQMHMPRVWMRLPALNRECLKNFGCPLLLVVAEVDGGKLRIIETLWDPSQPQH